MDNVGIVVDDVEAAAAFFVELGLELEGEAALEGRWVDRVVGLDGVRVDVAMVRTPDGHGRLELTKFRTPTAVSAEPNPPANTHTKRFSVTGRSLVEDAMGQALRINLERYVHPNERLGLTLPRKQWLLAPSNWDSGRRRQSSTSILPGNGYERALRRRSRSDPRGLTSSCGDS